MARGVKLPDEVPRLNRRMCYKIGMARKRKETMRPEVLSGPDETFRLMDEAHAQPSDGIWRREALYGRTKYSLEELVSPICPANRHAEADWGAPQGNER